MTKEEFTAKLSRLKSVNSRSGNNYRDLFLDRDRLSFRREEEFVTESIPIQELFDFYTSGKPINVINAEAYIPIEHQLPAVDILRELPDEDLKKEYHEFHSEMGEKDNSPAAEEFERPSDDEVRFFKVFAEIIDFSHIRSRSLGKPISSAELFLSNNYRDYNFPEEIEDIFKRILEALLSDGRFQSQDLTAYVDGMVLGHPELKNRIVAFDEEEHFTPARRDSLLILSSNLSLDFRDRYIGLCSDLDYLKGEVFQKYRISPETLAGLPETFARFSTWLESGWEEESGHLEEKTAFGFKGGRIAQRAYYDSLLDSAHVSEKNQGFGQSIRFAKKSFEDIAGIRFSGISDEKLKEITIQLLREDYGLMF